jgi:hypothetical protein
MQVKSLKSLIQLLREAGRQAARFKWPIAKVTRMAPGSEEMSKNGDRELERIHIQFYYFSVSCLSKYNPGSADKGTSEVRNFVPRPSNFGGGIQRQTLHRSTGLGRSTTPKLGGRKVLS